MNPTIRCKIVRLQRENANDINQFEPLYRIFAEEEGHTAPPEQVIEYVEQRLDDDTMLLLLALANVDGKEQAVGYALVFDVIEHPFIPDWERTGYITQMFVRPDVQRQGIGHQLFEASRDWLAQRDVGHVMLNVDVDNENGEAFWQKLGFTPYLTRMRRAVG